MRAAPPFQVSLQRFGVWQRAVWIIAALGVAVIVVWLVTRGSALMSLSVLAALPAALAVTAIGRSLANVPAVDLRWDGRSWHLGAAACEPIAGDLSVAIDLGAWMLLRFCPAPAFGRPRATWLPVQRRGLEPQWHALRCAVYSPRPAPADDPPVAF